MQSTANHIYGDHLLQILNRTFRRLEWPRVGMSVNCPVTSQPIFTASLTTWAMTQRMIQWYRQNKIH